MNIILHQLKKDFSRTRWLILTWFIIVVLRFALVAANVNPADVAWQVTFQLLGLLSTLLDSLLVLVIVPLVIQQEPLIGTDAFWLTRPLSRETLFASKALFALILLLVPLIVQTLVMLANGVTLSETLLALPWMFLLRLNWFLTVAMLAVLTPGFGRFAIAVAIYFIVSCVFAFVFQITRIFVNPLAFSSVLPSLTASRALISASFIVAAGTVVLFAQYLWRKPRLAIAVTVSVILVPTLISEFWTWNFLKPRPQFVADANIDLKSFGVGLGSFLNVFDQPSLRGGMPKKTVYTSIVPTGLAPEGVLEISDIKSTLKTKGGTVIPVDVASQSSFFNQTRNIEAIRSAIGVPIVNATNNSTISTQLFTMDNGDYGKYRQQTLCYQGEVSGTLCRYVQVAELPLKKGAEFRRGSYRVTITNVLHETDGVDFTARVQDIKNSLALRPGQDNPNNGLNTERGAVLYLLVNRRLNQAVAEKQNANFGGGFSFDTAEILQHKSLYISFGRENENSDWIIPIDEAWLKDAVLVRLELLPVTHFTKTIVDPDFRFDQNAAKRALQRLVAVAKIPPAADLEQIKLPANPSRQQVTDYIQAIVSASQQQDRWSDTDPEIEMLKQVGAENVDLLIQAGATNHNYYLNRAINAMAQPDQKELILRALLTNHDLINVIIAHGWQQDAKPVLVGALSIATDSRSLPNSLPSPWIGAIAAFHDPKTYPALRDYYVKFPFRPVYELLARIPDFNLSEAVNLAWKAVPGQLHTWSTRSLLGPAAEIGEADFPDVAMRLLETGTPYDQQEAAKAIRAYTPAAGATNADLLSWMKANRARLIFDAAAKKFILSAQTSMQNKAPTAPSIPATMPK